MKIIVAKYKEDVSWTDKLGGEVIVINKDPAIKTSYDLPNHAGRECSSYLDYIVKNYDSLEGEYLFTQGRYDDQAPEIIDQLFAKRYFGHYYECNADGVPHIIAPLHTYARFLGVDRQDRYKFRCGAFMRLNADHIKEHSKEYYEMMLRVCKEEPISSHCYERLWSLIFPILQKDL